MILEDLTFTVFVIDRYGKMSVPATPPLRDRPQLASVAGTEGSLSRPLSALGCPADEFETMANLTSLLPSSVMNKVRLRAQDTPT